MDPNNIRGLNFSWVNDGNYLGNPQEIFFFTKQIAEIQIFMLNFGVSQPSHVGKLDGQMYE